MRRKATYFDFKAKRLALKMTHEELAYELGVSISTIQRQEKKTDRVYALAMEHIIDMKDRARQRQ
jgi:transcriptional regulator with XRE-family HTH domain